MVVSFSLIFLIDKTRARQWIYTIVGSIKFENTIVGIYESSLSRGWVLGAKP